MDYELRADAGQTIKKNRAFALLSHNYPARRPDTQRERKGTKIIMNYEL
jgi:hypothetical protein